MRPAHSSRTEAGPEIHAHSSARTAHCKVPVCVHIPVRGHVREGTHPECRCPVPLSGHTSSSEAPGFVLNVGKSANSQNTTLEENPLPNPQESRPTSSIWNFLKPNPLINVKTRTRGNFLKKCPPILSCHRRKMASFFFACEGKKSRQVTMLSLKSPHLTMPFWFPSCPIKLTYNPVKMPQSALFCLIP